MFNCYLHSWSSRESPCPICVPAHKQVYSSTDIDINVVDSRSERIEELEELKTFADTLTSIVNHKDFSKLIKQIEGWLKSNQQKGNIDGQMQEN